MNSLDTIIEFLGWCSVINISLLIFSVLVVILFRIQISHIHAKMFNLNEEDISNEYFRYLAQYKIVIIVFNIVPYFALRIIS